MERRFRELIPREELESAEQAVAEERRTYDVARNTLEQGGNSEDFVELTLVPLAYGQAASCANFFCQNQGQFPIQNILLHCHPGEHKRQVFGHEGPGSVDRLERLSEQELFTQLWRPPEQRRQSCR